MYQPGKNRQIGAALESPSAVWEKQVILALFNAKLHIVSTSALSLSHFPLRTDCNADADVTVGQD